MKPGRVRERKRGAGHTSVYEAGPFHIEALWPDRIKARG
jgi:hypothetical protein